MSHQIGQLIRLMSSISPVTAPGPLSERMCCVCFSVLRFSGMIGKLLQLRGKALELRHRWVATAGRRSVRLINNPHVL